MSETDSDKKLSTIIELLNALLFTSILISWFLIAILVVVGMWHSSYQNFERARADRAEIATRAEARP